MSVTVEVGHQVNTFEQLPRSDAGGEESLPEGVGYPRVGTPTM